MSDYNIYATNPLLKGVRTEYDLKMAAIFGRAAAEKQYGPNPSGDVYRPMVNNRTGLMPLGAAYQFNGGSFFNANYKP